MKSRKVISRKNLPFGSPILPTVVYVTALHYWNAPQWLWGVFGLLTTLYWILVIVDAWNKEDVDVISKIDKK